MPTRRQFIETVAAAGALTAMPPAAVAFAEEPGFRAFVKARIAEAYV